MTEEGMTDEDVILATVETTDLPRMIEELREADPDHPLIWLLMFGVNGVTKYYSFSIVGASDIAEFRLRLSEYERTPG